jgi:hypothetical protein
MNALAALKEEVSFAIKAMVKHSDLVQRAHKLEETLVELEEAEKDADEVCDSE